MPKQVIVKIIRTVCMTWLSFFKRKCKHCYMTKELKSTWDLHALVISSFKERIIHSHAQMIFEECLNKRNFALSVKGTDINCTMYNPGSIILDVYLFTCDMLCYCAPLYQG